MTRCACPATSLTSLRFADGLVMVRCSAHEQQAWLRDGQPAEKHEVLPALKDLFVDRRGERSTSRRAAKQRVVRLPQTPPYEAVLVDADERQDDGARLTALLRARGLSGTWAVS